VEVDAPSRPCDRCAARDELDLVEGGCAKRVGGDDAESAIGRAGGDPAWQVANIGVAAPATAELIPISPLRAGPVDRRSEQVRQRHELGRSQCDGDNDPRPRHRDRGQVGRASRAGGASRPGRTETRANAAGRAPHFGRPPPTGRAPRPRHGDFPGRPHRSSRTGDSCRTGHRSHPGSTRCGGFDARERPMPGTESGGQRTRSAYRHGQQPLAQTFVAVRELPDGRPVGTELGANRPIDESHPRLHLVEQTLRQGN